MALPNVPPLGLCMFTWPMLLAHRMTGYVPKAFRYPFEGDVPPQYEASARMTFFDAPKTQQTKRKVLEKAGVDSAEVTFVAADFEEEDWLARLVDAGFNPARPALFLWEGVTVYLEKEAVEATLRKIAGTARGSVVTFDHFTTEPLESRALYWRYARAATTAAGEPLRFGVDSTPPSRERLSELLQSCGLALVEQRTLGQETGRKRAWAGFATATVTEAFVPGPAQGETRSAIRHPRPD
jgi:O-methyltransferase involved in polyketide biosynthesis